MVREDRETVGNKLAGKMSYVCLGIFRGGEEGGI